jgi:dTDP-4-dehydrorhamnose reductase
LKLLIVGGAGYVGQLVCPAIDQEHDCTHYDQRPVSGAEDRTIIADVNDDDAIKDAVRDFEGVLYMAMGTDDTGLESSQLVDPAFDVNVKGLYRFVSISLHSGVNWFCYVSSLSVYEGTTAPHNLAINERVGADSWGPYGMSKRIGEFLCESLWRVFPQSVVLSLRLCLPKSEEDWLKWQKYVKDEPRRKFLPALGPESTRQLFLAALRCNKPGCHILNTTGDVDQNEYDNSATKLLLGWEPHAG